MARDEVFLAEHPAQPPARACALTELFFEPALLLNRSGVFFPVWFWRAPA
jgi:hypothetical protein